MRVSSTIATLAAAYLAVLAVMVGWWLLLQGLTEFPAVWVVLGGYAAPLAAWGLTVAAARGGGRP